MWHFLGTNIRMVFETDESEAWTVLGKDEPDNYDYESDEHTEVIERAMSYCSLISSIHSSKSS